MKTTASYLRVIGFIAITYLLLEFTNDNGAIAALEQYPILWAIIGMVLIFAAAMEVIVEALKNILFRSLDAEAQQRHLEADALIKEKRFSGVKRVYNKLLGSRPMEQEGEIDLAHDYDGIRELDNNLPPWWVYLFYVTIIFAVVYLVRFEVIGDYNQDEEYVEAVKEAEMAIAEYKKNNKDLVDADTVELLTDPADLNAGKVIFTENCVACHKDDGGGGIGPNLTDEYWILGGGIKNVFKTIMEGGRDGKGMISWKSELKPSEIAQVGSYILTFQGTTPAAPKNPEGEVWVDPDAPVKEIKTQVIDSTATEELN